MGKFVGKRNITQGTADVVIGSLNDQGSSLLELVKKYRAEMDLLPANDPARAVYEKTIRDLLAHVDQISQDITVTSTASSSNR